MNIPKIDAINPTFSLSINGKYTSRGKSAYEIAVENGFKGTEQEWLESLKGGSVNIKGSVDTVDDLPLIPEDDSDAWVVSSTGHLYVWSDGEWKDVGQFAGKDGKDGVDGVDGKDGVSPLVLQELGDSKEDSMSQDAITREIEAIRKYTGQEFNFERDSFDTISEMKNASDADYPDGFVVFCKQTWEHFMRCSLCPDDSEYGNWINMSAVYDFYDNEPNPLNYYRPVAYGAWYEDRMAIVNELKNRAKQVIVNGVKNNVVDGVVNLGSIGQVLQVYGTDTTKAMSQDATTKELAKKVDKVTGKGLSTNDYTTAEKQKLAGLSNYNDSSVVKSIKINGETKTPTAGLVDLGNAGGGGASKVTELTDVSNASSASKDTILTANGDGTFSFIEQGGVDVENKADVYSYLEYNGSISNGYWNANGVFVANSSARAVEFDCVNVQSIYIDSLASTSERIVLYRDGVIVYSGIIQAGTNVRVDIFREANLCKLSSSNTRISSLRLSKRYDEGKSKVLRDVDILSNGVVKDAISNTAPLPNNAMLTSPEMCLSNRAFSNRKATINYTAHEIFYDGNNFINSEQFCFEILSKTNNIKIIRNNRSYGVTINGELHTIGEYPNSIESRALLTHISLDSINKKIIIHHNGVVVADYDFPDGFECDFESAYCNIRSGASNFNGLAYSYLYIPRYNNEYYLQTSKKFIPTPSSIFPTPTTGNGNTISYDSISLRYVKNSITTDISIGDLINVASGEQMWFASVANGVSTNGSVDNVMVYKISVEGSFTIAKTNSFGVVCDYDNNPVNLNTPYTMTSGVYYIYVYQTSNFAHNNSITRLSAQSDSSIAVEYVNVYTSTQILSVNPNTARGLALAYGGTYGLFLSEVKSISIPQVVTGRSIHMCGVISMESDGAYLSCPSSTDVWSNIVWKKITP